MMPQKTAVQEWRELRIAILERDNYACQFCTLGEAAVKFLEIHHILPVRYGGTNNPVNLITLCDICHRSVELNKVTNSMKARLMQIGQNELWWRIRIIELGLVLPQNLYQVYHCRRNTILLEKSD